MSWRHFKCVHLQNAYFRVADDGTWHDVNRPSKLAVACAITPDGFSHNVCSWGHCEHTYCVSCVPSVVKGPVSKPYLVRTWDNVRIRSRRTQLQQLVVASGAPVDARKPTFTPQQGNGTSATSSLSSSKPRETHGRPPAVVARGTYFFFFFFFCLHGEERVLGTTCTARICFLSLERAGKAGP